jgi:hypothetical protein
VSAYFFALSSMGASVRTTPFVITGFSIGSSLIAVTLADSPGSLKIRRVAPAMLDPWISIVTRVPRCAPVGLTLSSVGGAVCATAAGAAAATNVTTNIRARVIVLRTGNSPSWTGVSRGAPTTFPNPKPQAPI